MAITPEEGQAIYKKALNQFNQYSTTYSSAKKSIETNTELCQSSTKTMSAKSSELSNFEERLSQVKALIKALTKTVNTKMVTANKSASKSSGLYEKAIRCNAYAAANIAEVFQTVSVEDDSNTNGVLTDCNTEKTRLEKEITRLKNEIKTLKSNIEMYNREIKKYVSIRDNSKSSAKKYYNVMEQYKQYK